MRLEGEPHAEAGSGIPDLLEQVNVEAQDIVLEEAVEQARPDVVKLPRVQILDVIRVLDEPAIVERKVDAGGRRRAAELLLRPGAEKSRRFVAPYGDE